MDLHFSVLTPNHDTDQSSQRISKGSFLFLNYYSFLQEN